MRQRELSEHGFMSRERSGAGGTGSVRLQSGVRSGCGGTSLAVPASRHHHLIWGSRRLGRALPHASPQSSSGEPFPRLPVGWPTRHPRVLSPATQHSQREAGFPEVRPSGSSCDVCRSTPPGRPLHASTPHEPSTAYSALLQLRRSLRGQSVLD